MCNLCINTAKMIQKIYLNKKNVQLQLHEG